tara:strand:- start:8052 stop:8741 length:690 start_codon:yes stop_codon:yes gene_type:complete
MFKIASLASISVFFNCLLAFDFSNKFEINTLLTDPSFNFLDSKQRINLTGESAESTNGFSYLIYKPELIIKSDNFYTTIKALNGELNRTTEIIDFRNSVTFYTLLDEEIIIQSEKLSFDLSKKKIMSNEQVFASFYDVNINSLGLEVIQDNEGIKAKFNKGEVKINDRENYLAGYANKITILSERNEMIMDGEAFIDQDGFKIKSETIHYNLKENRIIKSLNSTIENNG